LNTSGSLLTCTGTLSSRLPPTFPTRRSSDLITTTAPSSAGSITNYASVDPTGGNSPATPGSSCSTTSCASAATTVNATPSSANRTDENTSELTSLAYGLCRHLLDISNNGGTT